MKRIKASPWTIRNSTGKAFACRRIQNVAPRLLLLRETFVNTATDHEAIGAMQTRRRGKQWTRGGSVSLEGCDSPRRPGLRFGSPNHQADRL